MIDVILPRIMLDCCYRNDKIAESKKIKIALS